MSKMEIYGIYDEASEAFVQFLPAINEKIARMTCEKMFKEKRFNVAMLYDYPNQFKVNLLGTFDDNTGLFKNVTQSLLLDFGSLIPVTNSES